MRGRKGSGRPGAAGTGLRLQLLGQWRQISTSGLRPAGSGGQAGSPGHSSRPWRQQRGERIFRQMLSRWCGSGHPCLAWCPQPRNQHSGHLPKPHGPSRAEAGARGPSCRQPHLAPSSCLRPAVRSASRWLLLSSNVLSRGASAKGPLTPRTMSQGLRLHMRIPHRTLV